MRTSKSGRRNCPGARRNTDPSRCRGRSLLAAPSRTNRQTKQKNTIIDEFSNLPVSRQRKYQLRKQRDKRCTLCGLPAVHGLRCLAHLVKDRELRRKRYGYTKRYQNSMGYRLEAAQARGTL
jgi:hypothetical protein